MNSDLYQKFENINKSTDVGDDTDTNLLDVIHLSENDHTKILWRILRFKKGGSYPFLDSFLRNVVGLNKKECASFCKLMPGSGTQYQAISPKEDNEESQEDEVKKGNNDSKGYIDLLIKGNKRVVIIENKVCGAGDSKFQLARYYHSFVEWNQDSKSINTQECKDFLAQKYQNYHDNHRDNYHDDGNAYVVYLTLDGKEPSVQSKQNINYISATYLNDDSGRKSILSWLKEDVLTQMPHLEKGNLLQSLIIYIDYIEHKLMDDDDKFLSPKVYQDLFGSIPVQELLAEYKLLEKDDINSDYEKCLKSYINANLNKLLILDGWTIHWTSGYICYIRMNGANMEQEGWSTAFIGNC